MNTRQVNDFVGVVDTQTINYNKDIIMTDLESNQKIVVKCYCTIVAYQSISYYMDVLESLIFKSQRDTIQAEIDKFKVEAEKIARDNNVPII